MLLAGNLRYTSLEFGAGVRTQSVQDFVCIPFQHSIDKRQITELSSMAFALRGDNVVLLGPPDVGKTHLAVGLALKTLENGLSAYYTTLSTLIGDLKKVQEQGRLERRWRIYIRPTVLVIDEVVSPPKYN